MEYKLQKIVGTVTVDPKYLRPGGMYTLSRSDLGRICERALKHSNWRLLGKLRAVMSLISDLAAVLLTTGNISSAGTPFQATARGFLFL